MLVVASAMNSYWLHILSAVSFSLAAVSSTISWIKYQNTGDIGPTTEQCYHFMNEWMNGEKKWKVASRGFVETWTGWWRSVSIQDCSVSGGRLPERPLMQYQCSCRIPTLWGGLDCRQSSLCGVWRFSLWFPLEIQFPPTSQRYENW